jgi:hypothetical protein
VSYDPRDKVVLITGDAGCNLRLTAIVRELERTGS